MPPEPLGLGVFVSTVLGVLAEAGDANFKWSLSWGNGLTSKIPSLSSPTGDDILDAGEVGSHSLNLCKFLFKVLRAGLQAISASYWGFF